MKVSDNFDREEMACKCGCGFDTVDIELLAALESLRAHFNKPIKITSGNRCESHNERVGGSFNSQHTKGLAADIQVFGIIPELVYNYLDHKHEGKFGVGRYKTWVHLDVKPGDARRWDKT